MIVRLVSVRVETVQNQASTECKKKQFHEQTCFGSTWLFVSSDRNSYSDDGLLYVHKTFWIFTQSIGAIDFTGVTLSRWNSINAFDVTRCKLKLNLNVPIFQCSNVPMFQCSNVQMLKWSNIQMLKCSKVPMFQCSNVHIVKWSNV